MFITVANARIVNQRVAYHLISNYDNDCVNPPPAINVVLGRDRPICGLYLIEYGQQYEPSRYKPAIATSELDGQHH